MSDQIIRNIGTTGDTASFSAIEAVLLDVDGACGSLPEEEQARHRAAQQSVVDARRSAELHEGLLQVC